MKSALGAVVLLVLLAFWLAPALFAWHRAPAEVWSRWPVFVVAMAPGVLGTVALLAYFGQRGAVEEPHATTALEWLRQVLDRIGIPGIHIAELEREDGKTVDANFYVPHVNTIVLAGDVMHGHSTTAHVIAAHELGHALTNVDHPRLEAVGGLARAWSGRLFFLGAGLVIGTAMVGGATLRWVGLGLVLLAFAASCFTLAMEALASAIGYRLLRAHLGRAPRGALGTLIGAATTYASQPLAMLAVAVVFAWWNPWLGDGVIVPGSAVPAIWWHHATALAILLGPALTLLAFACYPLIGRGTWFLAGAALLVFGGLTFITAPFLVVAVCTDPGMPSWTFVLAFAACWEAFIAFLGKGQAWIAHWLTVHLREMRALVPAVKAPVARLPRQALVGELGLATLAPLLIRVALLVPLAVWWLIVR